MMKKLFILIALAICQSCSNEDIVETGRAPLTFNIGMSINSFNSQTKSMTAELAAASKSIEYFDYKDGVVQKEIHQKNTSSTYGQITDTLDYGTHNLYIIAHSSTDIFFNYDQHTVGFDKVTDTFAWHQQITVDEATAPNINVALSRAVGRIQIEATDAIPVEAASIVLSISNYSSRMVLETCKGENNMATITRTFVYSEAQKWMKNTTYSAYSFIPSDTYKVKVVLDVLDANNKILNSTVIDNAPIYLNKITHYTGRLFTKSSQPSFILNIDTAWGETINRDY